MQIVLGLLLIAATAIPTDDGEWKELAGPSGLSAWKSPTADWQDVRSVGVDPANPKSLTSEPGSGVLMNGPRGRTLNLVSQEEFGDIEVHLEFFIPKGSNAGIKLEGLYEVQILDSYGKEDLKAIDCGGIYPRAELLPRYRYLDEGHPPKVNACKPPGQWQSLDIVFIAPRFDENNKKIANARFEKVLLNDTIVQQDLDVATPTGHAYRTKEVPRGPILIQADHGPVAIRSLKVRPLGHDRKDTPR